MTAAGVAVAIDDTNGGAWMVYPVDGRGRVYKQGIASGATVATLKDWLKTNGLLFALAGCFEQLRNAPQVRPQPRRTQQGRRRPSGRRPSGGPR